jgi:hypothetical protein
MKDDLMSDISSDSIPAADTSTDTGAVRATPRHDLFRKTDTGKFRRKALSLVESMGGIDALNAGQLWLVRTATQLSIECERMEAVRARGEEIDTKEYGMMSDRLGRTLARLGLEPEPRAVHPMGIVAIERVIVHPDGTREVLNPGNSPLTIECVTVDPPPYEPAVIEQPQLATDVPERVPPPPERIELAKPVVPTAKSEPWRPFILSSGEIDCGDRWGPRTRRSDWGGI